MAEVQWFKGEINPPESGEYYIIIEAQHDIVHGGKKLISKGEIQVDSEYFDVDTGEYDTIDKDNPTWKVLCWADILKPDIPKDLIGRVTRYLGKKVVSENDGE